MDLEEARDGNFQEISGTDDDLQNRLNRFDAHVDSQRERLAKEERRRQDIEDELTDLRNREVQLSEMKAQYEVEAKNQRARVIEREELVREIAKQFNITGISSQSLDKSQVSQFLSRLTDLRRDRTSEIEQLQLDASAKNDEFNAQRLELDRQVQTHKIRKTTLKDQLSERNASIKQAQRQLDEQATHQASLNSLQEEMQEKEERIKKLRKEMANSEHDKKLQEKIDLARQLEEKRESLMEETRALSTQADSRAKLDLKRTEIRTKTVEIQTIMKTVNQKYREHAKRDLDADTAEIEVDRVIRQKEDDVDRLEAGLGSARASLHSVETEMANIKAQISAKESECEKHTKKITSSLRAFDLSPDKAVNDAIEVAQTEINHIRSDLEKQFGPIAVYQRILEEGVNNHICLGCNRGLRSSELKDFKNHLEGMIKDAEKTEKRDLNNDLEEWNRTLVSLTNLKGIEHSRHNITTKEIPALKATLEEKREEHQVLEEKAETLGEELEEAKDTLKALSTLKQNVSTVSRLKKEIERAEKEVSDLETDLSLSGSTKTVDDVQAELNEITSRLRAIEKERQAISTERERQTTALHSFETRLNDLKVEEQKLLNQLNEVDKLSERVQQMKNDIVTFTAQLKDLDTKIAEAQAPIQGLEEEQRQVKQDFDAKMSQAQSLLGQLNARTDKLAAVHKDVERYARDKRDRLLEECIENIKQCKEHQGEATSRLQGCREAIKVIEKEINEAGASQTNLRENIRVRKLQKEILEIQAEIESYDVEEAAKARRNFQDQWEKRKEKEERLNKSTHHLAGELSSLKSQHATLESDIKEFKDVNKMYTEQLVKVKISDMANSDLEKYAKALDNAIMKYHGLKMEEVNDTMKHLWNKTYQGTDIDGIKIKSDVEGGASKRSYNYRVVMTKDQVEMDMRGRCSAGQKMLASIIIRLALSDSFGQNCGILALDEPTNALDTENIDALAESLVDIINERKSHSNFQLIIITHDENFLRKLGQSDVMEYYWRVSRDARQKSVIERQRFR
ncbi:RAD50 [Coprinopsis cinerea AmutBmut pab1-1]|nr:RAD50 [Coprinopsis cinerea AmutBmut pab1-1]